jgi:hypothetical protein
MSKEKKSSWLQSLFGNSKPSPQKPSLECQKKRFILEKFKKVTNFLEEENAEIDMENLGMACRLLMEKYSVFSATNVLDLAESFSRGLNDPRTDSVKYKTFKESKPPKS